ncbi:LysR family transcriptional regulator [Rhodococcus sp. RS1C4]|uniref:LysR family transcriptional regulator n=1 Tax=Nocardiaceae TaxID=85025 RepID=UPI00036C1D18|nr:MULTISPECIES: LysR family transcriptional regulator [Rhodococcus]OZC56633.1 LysR family transcriptional regulator [Rhodococcus sp. RS1C4]OZC58665.1 LysR family transcriptional regulator [Rhodococcus sp. 06-621-2]OZC86204.1 LysR family transcriptional regulator [Rhodococcus sp. 06-418-1B]OZD11307.1 LysR family transcriptional regulator [Rhodococcus sp. 06-156-3C]OZD13540.1 LysR family transcriptional regulator [Rhodococcus sp. 06-156-4a]
MLNVPRLRILLELQRRGTLAEVARVMSYTPSAVSQQLSLLEKESGVRLLEPVGRGVTLTDAAIGLAAHAEIVLRQLEEAEADLASAQSAVQGTLRVASFQTVVFAIVPAVLDLLAAEEPSLTVEFDQLQVVAAYDGLLSHSFDLILGEEYPGMPEPVRANIDRADLAVDPLLLAVPSEAAWLPSARTDLAGLFDVPWAMDPPDSATGTWARSVCRAAGFEPRVRFVSPDPLMHAHLVRTGHAAAFIPALIAANQSDGLDLRALPGRPDRTIYTAVRAGRGGHPAIRAFRAALASTAAARTSEWNTADGLRIQNGLVTPETSPAP